MCRVDRRELADTLASVAAARALVADVLRRWELPDLLDDAVLLTSELVTNAVRHARTAVTVSVAVADAVVEVGVADGSTSPPVRRSGHWDHEGGRGLRLTELVARDWGVTALPDGKHVWFRLDVGPDWPHRADCPCAGRSLEAVRLGSGRYAVAAPGPWDAGA